MLNLILYFLKKIILIFYVLKIIHFNPFHLGCYIQRFKKVRVNTFWLLKASNNCFSFYTVFCCFVNLLFFFFLHSSCHNKFSILEPSNHSHPKFKSLFFIEHVVSVLGEVNSLHLTTQQANHIKHQKYLLHKPIFPITRWQKRPRNRIWFRTSVWDTNPGKVGEGNAVAKRKCHGCEKGYGKESDSFRLQYLRGRRREKTRRKEKEKTKLTVCGHL